jgi:hypothetical protein
MAFSGDVQIVQGRFGARSGAARYVHPEARLDLTEGPRVEWKPAGDGDRDTVRVEAGRIEIRLEEGRVSRIEMFDSTSVRMVVSRDTTIETRTLLADTCAVDLEGDRIAEVAATGRVEARLRSDKGDRTDLAGHRSRLVFREGEIDSLIFEDAEEGTHRPAGGKEVSRLAGSWMALTFTEGQVRRIVSADQARCEHESLETTETIRLTGDRVVLSFEAGALDSATADGGVRGSFVPAKTGDEP